MFLLKIHDQCNDVIYYEPALEEGPKLVDEIYKNKRVKVIIIDNINKLKKNDWNILPRLLKDGIIGKKIKKNKIEVKLENIKIFAVLNEDQERLDANESLSKLRAMFVECHIPEYTDDEFKKSVEFYCRTKFSKEIIETIANELIKHNIKDIKEVIFFSKIVREYDTREDIVRIIEGRVEHRSPKDINL